MYRNLVFAAFTSVVLTAPVHHAAAQYLDLRVGAGSDSGSNQKAAEQDQQRRALLQQNGCNSAPPGGLRDPLNPNRQTGVTDNDGRDPSRNCNPSVNALPTPSPNPPTSFPTTSIPLTTGVVCGRYPSFAPGRPYFGEGGIPQVCP